MKRFARLSSTTSESRHDRPAITVTSRAPMPRLIFVNRVFFPDHSATSQSSPTSLFTWPASDVTSMSSPAHNSTTMPRRRYRERDHRWRACAPGSIDRVRVLSTLSRSTWGLESDYGVNQGKYSTIRSQLNGTLLLLRENVDVAKFALSAHCDLSSDLVTSGFEPMRTVMSPYGLTFSSCI
jgi:hypothetical protein